MEEVLKAYADSFEIMGHSFGATLKFKRRVPLAVATPPPPEDIAEISTSWEHLKAMVYILWRYIKATEAETGVSYPVPSKTLSDLRIALEDWEAFWRPSG